MFGWLAKWQMSRPVSDFLLGQDYESLWGASFRWCNLEPPSEMPEIIPANVKETLHRLVLAVFRKEITGRRPDGSRIPISNSYFLFEPNPWSRFFWRCLQQSKFDIAYLSKLFVERSEVLAWCENTQLPPPHFWSVSAQKEVPGKKLSLEGRLRNDVIDRLACQAIARVYWEIDQNIHPSHLAASRAIKQYGNGGLYKDESTVKGWIAEVDPLRKDRKTGAPKKIVYRIDLKTGGLAE